MKKLLFPLILLMIVGLTGFAVVMAVNLIGENGAPAVYELENAPPEEIQAEAEPLALEVFSHADGIYRISPGTIMTYEYFDPATGEFETIIEYASPILQGLTEGQLAAMFIDWHILSFTPYEVHLQQDSSLESRQFIISAHEGFIAIFYDDEQRSIKELTARPISALAEEEQQRLIEGIKVTGNEELIRALEDFGS
ncbi:MAG: hypothetical protein LBE35_05300 [Clostridiales bacterium]|nr:hypothetical protein [Clostridiales bacterium]